MSTYATLSLLGLAEPHASVCCPYAEVSSDMHAGRDGQTFETPNVPSAFTGEQAMLGSDPEGPLQDAAQHARLTPGRTWLVGKVTQMMADCMRRA